MRFIFSLVIMTMISLPLFSADETNSTNNENGLFTSDEDGAFDVSDYLATRYGFMPVPIIITEPAIGYGGGASVLFLHDTFASALKKKSPPSISGLAAMATENGTWAGAAFHMGYWREDTVRSTTAAGYLNVNIDLYPLPKLALAFNINGYMAYQELMFRLGKSNFFLGGNYVYVDNTIKLSDDHKLTEPINSLIPDVKMGGLAGIVQYDTRDSTFTPSSGLFAKATLRRFDEHLGGSQNFWRYGGKAFYFLPATPSLVMGIRVEGEGVAASQGDFVPIYSYPAIQMRGIPAMRYQGEKMLMGELQLRWEFINRWNIVAFGGAGKTFGTNSAGIDDTTFSDAPPHPAGGLGFRYELARKFGLWSGMDFATSEEKNFAFYFTVGSAWGAF